MRLVDFLTVKIAETCTNFSMKCAGVLLTKSVLLISQLFQLLLKRFKVRQYFREIFWIFWTKLKLRVLTNISKGSLRDFLLPSILARVLLFKPYLKVVWVDSRSKFVVFKCMNSLLTFKPFYLIITLHFKDVSMRRRQN